MTGGREEGGGRRRGGGAGLTAAEQRGYGRTDGWKDGEDGSDGRPCFDRLLFTI